MALDWKSGGVFWKIDRVGSRETCNPPPIGTDEDFLCQTFSHAQAEDFLLDLGFATDGYPEFYTGNDNGGFRSFRRGDTNLIVTADEKFGALFLTASSLAKRFNLLDKADRIALFQAVLYGVAEHNLQPKPSYEDLF